MSKTIVDLTRYGRGTREYVVHFSRSAFDSEQVRLFAVNFEVARREASRYLLRDEPIGKRDVARCAVIDVKAAGF